VIEIFPEIGQSGGITTAESIPDRIIIFPEQEILLSAVKISITQFLPPFKKTRLLSSPWTCPPSS